MKIIMPFVLVALCAAALSAQTVADKTAGKTAAAAAKTAAAAGDRTAVKPSGKKTAAAPAPAVSTAAAQADGKAARVKAQAAKQGEEGDDGTVMIDSRAEMDDGGYTAGQDYAAADVPGGIPSSYGQCKGVANEGGRTILIFESIEDGSITFVQAVIGKNSVSWKLVDKLGRSAD